MDRKLIDVTLYLVTDSVLCRGREILEIVEAAVAGGVTCVQLREKDADTRDFIEKALKIHRRLRQLRIPLVINDRVDVAMTVGAEGVHLGQRDMPLTTARALVGNTMVIGISAETIGDAVAAQNQGADYIGASPIFTTPTKPDTAAPLGLEGLLAMRRSVNLPIVGIGGLNRHNAAAVVRSGADGVAVVSAIMAAADPRAAALELRRVIGEARNPCN
jgi:thiamine-phosphate pyrophosphorylase